MLVQAARSIVEQFEDGWSAPNPTSFDRFLADDVVLKQPFLADVHGRDAAHTYLARLLLFAPTLQGHVRSWGATGNVLFIEVQMISTRRGRPVRWRLVDRCLFDEHGLVHVRESYFDAVVLASQIARSPALTLRWFWSRVVPNPASRLDRLRERHSSDESLP